METELCMRRRLLQYVKDEILLWEDTAGCCMEAASKLPPMAIEKEKIAYMASMCLSRAHSARTLIEVIRSVETNCEEWVRDNYHPS
jgi:hypothetical protein